MSQPNLVIIKTPKELQDLQGFLTDKDFIAFDTETTGVEKGATIIGFSVACDVDTGYYCILEAWDPEKKALVGLETKEGAKAFMAALVGKPLVMQNAGFDCARVFENYGVDLMPSVHTDTLLLGHLLNENRQNGLKERGVELYGEDARKEQQEMKDSVLRNGGVLTKALYELYKADADLIAKYGAMDAILTLKVFYNDVPILYEEGLDRFFYDEETMPLCRLATYEMNTVGLKVDSERMSKLKRELQTELLEIKAYIMKEITPIIKDVYPGSSKKTTFNIGSGQQIAWLLFEQLKYEFGNLTETGKELCAFLDMKPPYTAVAKREFIRVVRSKKGQVWQSAAMDPKTKRQKKPGKVRDPWCYLSTDEDNITKLCGRAKWIKRLLDHTSVKKLLGTYAEGIEEEVKYGIVRPSFLQHGTTSGRYSCRRPNFQTLPKNDKRVKACIVARPGKVFVGADHSQLEPRVFSSVSQDKALLECFAKGQDFYSVVGAPIFGKTDCSMYKKDPDSFATKYESLRDISKAFALASAYGTGAFRQSRELGLPVDECERIISEYFDSFPAVKQMMLDSHIQAKTKGVVYSVFGRPRRIPEAMDIPKIYRNTPHEDLPFKARNLLNLAMNHRCQSTAASIMNRNMIAVAKAKAEKAKTDPRWSEVKIVLQVHDSLVLEGPEALAQEMAELLRDGMENSVTLPGVALIAEPKIGFDLSQV